MSQENVEKLNAFYEMVNRREFDDAVQYLHPEIEICPALGGQLDVRRRYRGHPEAMQLMETISEGVEGIETRVEPEEAVEVGDDRVLRVEHWRPRGLQGIETEIELAHVYTFRDGLIARIDGFTDKAEALEAAGL
jgi:ketosteroid isomerase-like protein